MTATNAYHLWLSSLSLTSVSLVADILAVRSEKSGRAVLLIRELVQVVYVVWQALVRLPMGRQDAYPPVSREVLGSSPSFSAHTLTGLRNNVWNYVAEKRSREDSLGGEDLEPARGRKLNRFKPQVSSRPFLFSTNTL